MGRNSLVVGLQKMSQRTWLGLLMGMALASSLALADEASPLTRTRPEMKKQIESLKQRASRLPLPPPTEAERTSGRPLVNNGRLRAMYLPPSWQSFVIQGWGGSSSTKPAQETPKPQTTSSLLSALESTPGYGFKTRLFWIVSRTNDCQYCLGHQELKLKRIGMTDDQLAALDSRWELFPAAEQTAIAATRKLTIEPHRFGDADITALKEHFTEAEIIDMLYTVSRYNAVNRWTSSTGIPQDQSFGGDEHPALDTPTSAEFATVISRVAPTDHQPRPEWEPWTEVVSTLQSAHRRSPRVTLPGAESSQQKLAIDTPGVIPPVWFQAISELTVSVDAWRQRQAMVRDGKTPADLRILIAWVSARENRAWYAAGHSRARYLAAGGDESRLASFEGVVGSVPAGQAEAIRFARKLTVAPHTIVDSDIQCLREHFNDYEVAEIIQLTCDANAFDRLTESLSLPLEF